LTTSDIVAASVDDVYVDDDILYRYCSARELELEDRQSRLEAQLRERIAAEGTFLTCPSCSRLLH